MIQVEEPARRRGNIRPRGSSLQVRLFAGKDPVTGRDVYLTASIPGTDKKAGKKAEDKLAEFRTQVTKQRSTPSSMKLDYAIHEWMRTSEHEDSTREGYLGYITRTIRPTLGDVPITKITARMTGELLHRVAALPDAVRRAAVHRAQGGRGARLHDGEVRAACVQADGCLNRPSDPLDSQRHVGCCCAGGLDQHEILRRPPSGPGRSHRSPIHRHRRWWPSWWERRSRWTTTGGRWSGW